MKSDLCRNKSTSIRFCFARTRQILSFPTLQFYIFLSLLEAVFELLRHFPSIFPFAGDISSIRFRLRNPFPCQRIFDFDINSWFPVLCIYTSAKNKCQGQDARQNNAIYCFPKIFPHILHLPLADNLRYLYLILP